MNPPENGNLKTTAKNENKRQVITESTPINTRQRTNAGLMLVRRRSIGKRVVFTCAMR